MYKYLSRRLATQTMERLAQYFTEENTKHYNQKLFLDQCTDYFFSGKTDASNAMIILLMNGKCGKAGVYTINYTVLF